MYLYNITCNMTNKNVQTQRIHRCPHGPIAEIFCRQVETMMTTSEESDPLMKARLFRDHLPSQTNMSGWKIIPFNRRYTPPKLPWNLKITCLKRNMILQTSIFRLQNVTFFEGDTPSIHGCQLSSLSFVRFPGGGKIWDQP